MAKEARKTCPSVSHKHKRRPIQREFEFCEEPPGKRVYDIQIKLITARAYSAAAAAAAAAATTTATAAARQGKSELYTCEIVVV